MRQDLPSAADAVPLDHLVAKVLAGEATPEEIAAVRQAAPVSDALGLDVLSRATQGLQALPVPPGFDAQTLWRRLRARLDAQQTVAPVRKSRSPSVWRPWSGLGQYAVAWAAATVAALVLLVGVATRRDGPTSVTTYTTHAGQRAEITLPDGSTVLLNVASRLEVPTDFGRKDRTLRLNGEGVFTVAHRTGASFTVLANNAATRVLGTTFLVRHYDTDTATVVAVREGRVSVQSTVVAAGQQVTLSRGGRSRLARADASVFSVARGVLTLNDVSLQDAIVELNRWYDADIRLADPSLAAHRIKATCAAGSLADLAAILEFTLDVRVVRSGRILTLYPQTI